MKSNRLPGHELPLEGAAQYPGVANGEGFTTCSCGEKSPVLKNRAARKKWHREHKELVRKSGSAPPPPAGRWSYDEGGFGQPYKTIRFDGAVVLQVQYGTWAYPPGMPANPDARKCADRGLMSLGQIPHGPVLVDWLNSEFPDGRVPG